MLFWFHVIESRDGLHPFLSRGIKTCHFLNIKGVVFCIFYVVLSSVDEVLWAILKYKKNRITSAEDIFQ